MSDGFGSITWWGFSPAIDLQDDGAITSLKKLNITDSSKDELKILLIGAGDIRHILMTVARSYRHHKRKLHFYVLENSLELYARDMLLLAIALEKQKRMGLQEKTELFLELYGNILVRRQSTEYIEKMANEFIKMVTDFDYLDVKMPCIDLTNLKFKERDFLEGIFKFWRNPENQDVFEVSKYWEMRLRKLLGVRYDARSNMYDWDYQMRLAQREADIINLHEYKHWRETGVAFEVREADYEISNKTMASGLILTTREGDKTARRGYWGDIIVSPYVAMGIQCEDQSFFKKANKVFLKTACNIAEYNVLSMLHEIATKTKYVLPDAEPETPEQKGPTLTEITEEDEKEDKKTEVDSGEESYSDIFASESDSTSTLPSEEEFCAMPLEDVKISFLPIGSLVDMPRKSKFKRMFDIIYFSNSLVHLLKPDIAPMFKDKSVVILESARYMVELKLEQVKTFVEKVNGIAREAGCKSLEKCNPETANYIKLAFERKEK